MNERCRDCKAPAAYRCETRDLGPRDVSRGAQPYAAFFLCGPCTTKTVASDNPPRRVTPLPHEKDRLKELAG